MTDELEPKRKRRPSPCQFVDYRGLSLRTLFSPAYQHLLLLIFWPLFGIVFASLERLRTIGYVTVYSPLDDMIPFCEIFAIPYFFWFAYLVGMYVYSIFFDVETFKNYTYFIMITYITTLVIYIFFPTMQELRPMIFPRENFLTEVMRRFYQFDTNTNVCPSIHVIGSIAVSCAAWNSKAFSKTGWRIGFSAVTVLIILSTVFLKQHSILDIPPAVALCMLAYPLVYGKTFRGWLSKKRSERKEKNRQ